MFPRRQREERVRRHSAQALGPSGHRTSVTLDPYCAPALGRLYAERQRKYGRPDTGPKHIENSEKAPLSGSFFVQAVMFTQANTTSLALSIALGSGGDPAWGAKKVGEKPSFSPRASGGVT